MQNISNLNILSSLSRLWLPIHKCIAKIQMDEMKALTIKWHLRLLKTEDLFKEQNG